MGRNFAQSGVTLTARERALQDGTPKFLENGVSRACYAMASWNTTSNQGGVVLFDRYFQPIRSRTRIDSFSSQNDGNYLYIAQGDASNPYSLFSTTWAASQSTPSSNGTSDYANATNASGEFGNALMDIFSNGTIAPVTSRNSSWPVKHGNNARFVDSDHTNRALVYILNGTTFRAISRIDGDYSYDYQGTTAYSISGIDGNMWGSASYNNVRKELVVMSYVGASGSFTMAIFQGIDFDKYPSPADAFAAAGVTRTDKAFTISSNWATNDNESYYNPKPVLCDNGDVYITVMFQSNAFTLYKVTRDGSLNLTGTYITQKSLTTSYGRASGLYYGQRRIQSRDGGAVLAFCPYYYYGAGYRSYVIDKRKSTWFNSTQFDTTDSSYGYSSMPWGDSGFCVSYNGNAYAGNYTGNYITGFCDRRGDGNFQRTGTNIYLPYFPLPNTTNHPAFTQVTDYSMLTNQTII